MGQAPPTRVDDDVYNDAQATAQLTSRSTAQQISFWARIGRDVARRANYEQLLALLANDSYDDLDGDAQAIVRAGWSEMIERRASQNLAARFEARGESYAELDDDGNVVIRTPDTASPKARLDDAAVSAYFVAAYGVEPLRIAAATPPRRFVYDRWARAQPDAPSSAAILQRYRKQWEGLPWKKLRDLAVHRPPR
ncbi:MAG: hypothetical protein QOI61_2026 [Actinomycetota bacterium]|jgi:hypothetical protein